MRALKEVGAFVTGVGEAPLESLDPQLRDWLDAYEAVPSLLDEEAVTPAQEDPARWYSRARARLMPTTFIVKARKPNVAMCRRL